MSAEEVWQTAAIEEQSFDIPTKGRPCPRVVPADQEPDANPFFPVIMEELSPNTHGLVDVEEATFVSIVGGDSVYLGQITDVDAAEGRVSARLNKGGISYRSLPRTKN